MQKNPYVDQPMPLTGPLSMTVHDWEVHLALLISEDVGEVAALIAYDNQRVQITLAHPSWSEQ
jgi:hypothetical protein